METTASALTPMRQNQRPIPLNLDNEIARLAQRVARLSIDSRKPEDFYIERGEISHKLERL